MTDWVHAELSHTSDFYSLLTTDSHSNYEKPGFPLSPNDFIFFLKKKKQNSRMHVK